MTRRRNHGYWERKYRELQQREQAMGQRVARAYEIQAEVLLSLARDTTAN